MVRRRGASSLGCLLPLLVVAIGAYFAFDIGMAYFRFYQFKDAMGQEARFGGVGSKMRKCVFPCARFRHLRI